ncbi:MAG: TolC family protein [Acidobacteriota bacterium]
MGRKNVAFNGIARLLLVFFMACLFSVSLILTGEAGDGSTFTLREAIDYALSHNQDLARTRERVHEVQGMKKEAVADALPQVSTSIDSFRYRDPGILNSPNFQDFINDPNSPFPREALLPRPVNMYNVTFSLEQPIYSWGKLGKTVEAARIEFETTDLNIRAKEQEIAYNIAIAYYNLLLSYERLKVLEKAEETQENNLKIVSDKYEVETATKLDLLKAKTALSNLIPQRIAAENDVKIARAHLNYLMGRKIDEPLTLADSLYISEDLPSQDLTRYALIAFRERPDLASLDSGIRFLEKRIEIEKLSLRPSFNFFGNFGWSTIEMENVGKSDYESWRVGIGFKVTLFDGFRISGRIMQVQSQIMQNTLQKKYLESGITLEIEKTLKELTRAYESLQAALTAQEEANETLKVAQDNFDLNLATQLDVLYSESQVRQAELNVAQARRDCLAARASLKYLIGLDITKDLSVE